MMNNITIGIPTYQVGNSLIKTLRSIRTSIGGEKITIRVICDTNPVTNEFKTELSKLGVELIENKKQGTQYSKFKELISNSKTDYLMVTHDDVLFNANTIEAIKDSIKTNPKATIISSRITPVKPQSLLENILSVGQRIAYDIGANWRDGDNYLLANARCMTYKVNAVSYFNIPKRVVNGDAYLYFLNKSKKNIFAHSKKSIAFIKCPSSLKDHMNQNSRFQQSKREMETYFTKPFLRKEYIIPAKIILKSTITEFIQNPLQTLAYLLLMLVIKFMKKNRNQIENPNWRVDLSTKNR